MVYPHFLSPTETALYLAVKPPAVYRWMHRFHLPWYLFARRCPRIARIHVQKVIAWPDEPDPSLAHPETSPALYKALHLSVPNVITITDAAIILNLSRATAYRICSDTHYPDDILQLEPFPLPGPKSHFRITRESLLSYIGASLVIQPVNLDPRVEAF